MVSAHISLVEKTLFSYPNLGWPTLLAVTRTLL